MVGKKTESDYRPKRRLRAAFLSSSPWMILAASPKYPERAAFLYASFSWSVKLLDFLLRFFSLAILRPLGWLIGASLFYLALFGSVQPFFAETESEWPDAKQELAKDTVRCPNGYAIEIKPKHYVRCEDFDAYFSKAKHDRKTFEMSFSEKDL